MTPFLLFRLWLKRASAASKAGAAAVVAIVVGLVVWIAIPAGSATGASGTGLNYLAPTSGGSASPTAVSPGGASPTPAALTCTKAGSPIKVGVVIISIGTGSVILNSTFGVPSPSEQEKDYNAVFDSINRSSTKAACHPLVGDFQKYNELQANASAQAVCLQMAQAKVFAVLSGFLPRASDACLLQHQLPDFENIQLPEQQAKQFYPYYFSPSGTYEQVYSNFAHATKDAGYYGAAKQFTKLGVFYSECIPDLYQHFLSSLASVGVAGSQITSFDVGCPGAFASPAVLQQAVAKFKSAGVSTVVPIDEGSDLQAFTKDAAKQNFTPQYLLPDDGTVATSGSSQSAPDPANFDGAVAITPSQYGGKDVFPEAPATQACDKIMTSHGLPSVYQSSDQFAGAVCNFVWTFVAAINHDPSVSPAGLAGGLQRAGSVPMSYPTGPNNYSSSPTTGGQFWRAVTFHASCACWRADSAPFHGSYS